MKCLKCNFENPEGSIFCASCGNKIEAQINQVFVQNNIELDKQLEQSNVVPTVLEQSEVMKGKKNNALGIFLIVLAVIIILVLGIFMFVGNTFENFKNMFENGIEDELVKDEDNNVPEIINPAYTVGEEITLIDGSTWYYVSSDDEKVVLFSKNLNCP